MGIEIKNLKKSFDGKVIFDDFSYSFPDNGVFALIGPSGVGKTTLLRIISGLDSDFSGEILYDEKLFSFAFQEYRLFPGLNALDNVVFANFDKKTEAEEKMCSSILFELGFSEEDLLLLPGELSGGMKQRVSLARAFVNSSKTLLLDEPTKELDPSNAIKVLDRIKAEGRSRLVIVVTHSQEDVEYLGATRIEIN